MTTSRGRKRPAGKSRSTQRHHPGRAATPPTSPEPEHTRPAVLRFLDRIGRTEAVIFGLTIGIGVWAWMTYVAVPAPQQDIAVFGYTFITVSGLGALLQVIMAVYVRATGSWKSRLVLVSPDDQRLAGCGIVFWAPPIIFGLAFLAVTPPGTSARGFEYGWNIYQAIGLMVMLQLVATAIAAGAVFTLLVMPVAMLLGAFLPPSSRDDKAMEPEPILRRTAIFFASIIWSALGFGISMTAITPSDGGSTREAMGKQLGALVTLRGGLVPTLFAVGFLAALVVLVILCGRPGHRHAHAGLEHA